MSYAVDTCEHVPYSASLADATQSNRVAAFRARPPIASPRETINADRNAQMRVLLADGIREDGRIPSLSALENFDALLRLLPEQLPATDPYVEDCGSIVFDWDFEPRYQLAIMLKDKGQIGFAAYLSGEKVHGSTRFSPSELPATLAHIAGRWARSVGAVAK